MWSCGGGVVRQHHGPGVLKEAGWHSLFHSQCGGSDGSSSLRVLSHSTPSPVHSGPVVCASGFPEPQEPGHRLRVDPVFRGFLSASSPVASHHQSLHHSPQPPSSGVLFTDGGPTVSGHGRHAPGLGRPSGLCLSSLQPLVSTSEGPAVSRAAAHPDGSVLASAPVVPRLSGASGGESLLPATKEGSAQTATLPSLPPEPPCASADCLAYIK